MSIDRTIRDQLVEYIADKYGVSPEAPWEGYPDNLTFKDRIVNKWFALILPVQRRKLGEVDCDNPEEEIFVLNVKADTEFIYQISQVEGYLPAYHMNKKHWLSIYLDGSLPLEQILDCLDASYELVTNTPTKRIYDAVKQIPAGHVATYGRVAELAGDKNMARAVGNALHKNPDPDNIPCFRVVNAKGELAGAFAFGGSDEQEKLLIADGVEVVNGRVDLEKYGI